MGEGGEGGFGDEGVVEFYAEARGLGDGDVAAFAFVGTFVDGVVFGFVAFGVFLGDKVGDAGVEVERCGGANGGEEVVGDHGRVIRFGNGSNFFAVGDATGKGNVGAHVLGAAVF